MRLNLNIEDSDIRDYILSNQAKLKYKEGLFVEYIRNPNYVSLEAKIIIIKNNGLFFEPIEALQQLNNYLSSKYSSEYNLDFHLNHIKEHPVIIRNICYMVLPIITSLGVETFDINHYLNLCFEIKQELTSELTDEEVRLGTIHIGNVLHNYYVAGLIEKDERIKDLYKINITKEYARGMLLFYNKLYEKENVGKVKKMVKERMK